MGSLRRFLRRLVNVMRPGRDEAALEREVASHVLLLEDDYRRRGVFPHNRSAANRCPDDATIPSNSSIR